MRAAPYCDELHAFADGELERAEAERFREHLATCARCQRELEDVLQLASLSGELEKKERARVLLFPFKPTRRAAFALVSAVAAAAAVVLVVKLPRTEADPYGLGESRPLEARLTHAGASEYRRYDVARDASSGSARAVPLAGLARMEEKGDVHGVATGHLLRGERDQAALLLAKASTSADVQSDRAVVALSRGAADEALLLLDGALKLRPGHPQATWNRGLVLRELGLPLAAAEAFAEVVKLREPGWADEAARRVETLNTDAHKSETAWKAASGEGLLLVTRGELLPAETLRRLPGICRAYLYDALRAAPTADRAHALLPMARTLDEIYGGDVLRQLVEGVAAQDFARRGPLAADYLKLYMGQLDARASAVYLARLERSSPPDLRMGALLLSHAIAGNLEEYTALARQSADPWFAAIAAQEAAQAVAQDNPTEAERILRAALRKADEARISYRADMIDLALDRLYARLYRMPDAWAHAQALFRRARQTEEWVHQDLGVADLGSIAWQRGSYDLARAYLREGLLRSPGDCRTEQFAHRSLAGIALLELRPEEARREFDAAPSCGMPLGLPDAWMLADLLRLAPKPGDAQRLTEALEALRASGALSPGELTLLEQLEGRVVVQRDSHAGHLLLERAIAAAERLPATDVDAQKGRGYAYAALILEEAKAARYGAVLSLMAAEIGTKAPERCAVGVAVDDERSVIAVRSAKGDELGLFEGTRKQGKDTFAPHVSGALLDALQGCALVDVLARPPLMGRPDLLPAGVAWRYRVAKGAVGQKSNLPEKRLVVADVEPPPALSLPRLSAWPSSEATVELRGASATPARVLAEMEKATDIEINAHGLVDLAISDASLLVLSPDATGQYALTAGEVRAHRLEAAPLVILAACRGAQLGAQPHSPWSLPVAFLEAGAASVLAASGEVRDAQARPFFDAVRARVRAGQEAAAALRDERLAWRGRPGAAWVDSVLLFQ